MNPKPEPGLLPSLISLVGALLALGATALSAATPARPNFILFLIDDFGWSDLGCYDSDFYRTPNIDRLAAQGMRFTDAYAACSVCSPTRAAILTGKYPARLHLTDWLPGRGDLPNQKLARPPIRQQLPLEETTLAEALQSAGYATGHIGKWHLGGKGFEPQAQGFDTNIAGDHTGTPLSYFAPFRNERGAMPGLEDSQPGEYLTDRLTTEAENFIERNRARPFFLYFPHYTVHIPLRARTELIAKHEAAVQAGRKHTNAIYAAMIESLDDSVGRVMKKLDRLGLAGNTVILFTSDNGGLSVREGPNTPSTSNAPLRAGKGYLYEGGLRVPLIVKWPGVAKPGSTSAEPVCSIDFFPTLLEIAGVPSPGGAPVDGLSLVPLLRQRGGLNRAALFWHYPHYSNQGGKPGGAVRAGDFKLIEFFEDGKLELYNVREDLGERTNLVERMPDRAKLLHTRLADWRQSVNAQMMSPNPGYQSGTGR